MMYETDVTFARFLDSLHKNVYHGIHIGRD